MAPLACKNVLRVIHTFVIYLKEDKPFWVRNHRKIYFSYGNKKYYPDFIMYYQGMIYVLEAKGEIYHDWRKRILLTKLNEIPGYKGLLIFSKQLDEMGDEVWDLKHFIEFSEKVLHNFENSNKMKKPVKSNQDHTRDVAEQITG